MFRKSLSTKLCPIALAVSATLAFSTISYAAENEDADENEDNRIIVTAGKRPVYLQDVPMSIQSITNQQLEEMGADSFDDYYKTISSLSVVDRGPSNKKYVIRGTSSGMLELTAATVGVYIDEMPVSLVLNQPDIKLFDVERVEVLKGPQGTLYGEGSMGGTIKTITNKPDLSGFEGIIDIGWSTTTDGGDNTKFNAMVNMPVSDTMAVRLVAYNRDISGFIDRIAQPDGQEVDMAVAFGAPAGLDINVIFGTPPGTFTSIYNTGPIGLKEAINDEQTKGARASVLWNPSEDLSITLSSLVQNTDAGSVPIEVVGVGDYKTNEYTDETIKDDISLHNLTIDYDLGWATILSSTSIYDREFDTTWDFSGPGGLLTGGQITGGLTSPFYLHSDFFSEEIRLTSEGTDNFQYIVGLFYVDKELVESQTLADTTGIFTSIYNTYVAIGAFGPLPMVTDAGQTMTTLITTNETQKAIFGEFGYDVSDDIVATLGIRSFDIDQEVDFNNIGLDTYGHGILEDRPSLVSGKSETGQIYKFNLAYTASDDLLYYFTAAEGFRAGGNNSSPGLTEAQRTYDSDSLINYEAGVHSTLMDGKVTLNASVYRIDWSDIQITLPIGYTQAVLNAGEAEINGFEIDLVAHPFEGFQITMSLGSLTAELASDTPEGTAYLAGDTSVTNPGFKGDALPGVPDVNASIALQHNFPLSFKDFEGFYRIDYSYTGGSATTFNDNSLGLFGPNRFEIDSYVLGNLRMGVKTDDWTATLFITNISDNRVELTHDSLGITESITRNRPRTIGIDYQLHF